MPERERERRRRVARLEGARLLSTHPPTGARIRLLEERLRREPRVMLQGERADAVARELERFGAPVGRRLVDEYRDSLYYR